MRKKNRSKSEIRELPFLVVKAKFMAENLKFVTFKNKFVFSYCFH